MQRPSADVLFFYDAEQEAQISDYSNPEDPQYSELLPQLEPYHRIGCCVFSLNPTGQETLMKHGPFPNASVIFQFTGQRVAEKKKNEKPECDRLHGAVMATGSTSKQRRQKKLLRKQRETVASISDQ